jgi:hypothetical protein
MNLKKLGGYYMSFTAARAVAKYLNIDVGDDTLFNNQHMEWPINNWLYDNGKLHIKAALLSWPQGGRGEDGIFFMTKFCEQNQFVGDFKEDEGDLAVKEWLKECGAEEVRWTTALDRSNITLDGIQPRRNDIKFRQATLEEMLAGIGKSPIFHTSN